MGNALGDVGGLFKGVTTNTRLKVHMMCQMGNIRDN